MTIQTKYNIGDEIWILRARKIRKTKIAEIATKSFRSPDSGIITDAQFKSECSPFFFGEDEFFSTREALIASL